MAALAWASDTRIPPCYLLPLPSTFILYAIVCHHDGFECCLRHADCEAEGKMSINGRSLTAGEMGFLALFFDVPDSAHPSRR